MIFAGFQISPDRDPPKGFSIVRDDGAIWDFRSEQYLVEPGPDAVLVRPITFLKGDLHGNIAQLWADVPTPTDEARVAVFYHRDADGGPLFGMPEPVVVEQLGSFTFSYAFAMAK